MGLLWNVESDSPLALLFSHALKDSFTTAMLEIESLCKRFSSFAFRLLHFFFFFVHFCPTIIYASKHISSPPNSPSRPHHNKHFFGWHFTCHFTFFMLHASKRKMTKASDMRIEVVVTSFLVHRKHHRVTCLDTWNSFSSSLFEPMPKRHAKWIIFSSFLYDFSCFSLPEVFPTMMSWGGMGKMWMEIEFDRNSSDLHNPTSINSPLRYISAPSFMNFSFASSFFLPMLSSAYGISSDDFDAARTVRGESLDATDGSLFSETPSDGIFLDWLMIGVPVVVFDTFEMVTVVLIDCGCCFSDARCLFSVANDMTIWSQCDERSFLACPSTSRSTSGTRWVGEKKK